LKTSDVNKVNSAEAKWQYHITGISGVQLWNTWMIMWTSIGLEKILDKVSKLELKRCRWFL